LIDPADYEVTGMGYEQARLEQTEPIGTWMRFNAT